MPATINPTSGALGNKEAATLTAYTVTPEAGSTVTSIVEKVNGVTVNTFNNPASLSRTLTVPTATWDTLAYFATHTASVTVTDSNGATTVTTYSFDKRLATGASLLEATKANADAKNRISTKRDALAAQVGLSAGSTFDAISAQLTSGNAFMKVAKGSTSTSGANLTVTGIGFKPKLVVARFIGSTSGHQYVAVFADKTLQGGVYDTSMYTSQSGFGPSTFTSTDTGFTLYVFSAGTWNWIALG
ncbi:hypothetical protein [Exiguobacterium sp. S3]|uniref:hypothetical protein n=1 Tax=Exiguobacterium sp. S3 TaxID=483245 RepID=UPI001BE53007|nr:hypothetical protein [Exiguobacterium sp. S3]